MNLGDSTSGAIERCLTSELTDWRGFVAPVGVNNGLDLYPLMNVIDEQAKKLAFSNAFV